MADDFEIETDDDGTQYARIPLEQATNQRDLARKAKDLEATAAERDAAKRELAFLKAGVNPDSAVGKLFVKGYDGELDVEKIKAAAAEIPGLITEAAPAEGELTPEQEAAAKAEAEQTTARQQLASGNANAGTIPDRDPRELAVEAVQKARQAGLSEENALSAGLNELVGAAMAGDRRVRLPSFGDRGE
jgi:hypothetical protein